MKFDKLSNNISRGAIEIHRESGPRLLESTYEQCLGRELSMADILFEIQTPLPVVKRDCD